MPGGRPTLLTAELTAEICGAVREGMSLERAAALAGIHKRRIGEWRKRGEDDLDRDVDSVFADFALSYGQARAECAREWQRRALELAASGDKREWRAFAHMLGVRFPEYREQKGLDVRQQTVPPDPAAGMDEAAIRERLAELEAQDEANGKGEGDA